MFQTGPTAPPPEAFAAPEPERLATIAAHFAQDDQLFAGLVGIQIEEMRCGYARLRLPFRPQLMNAGGRVHGGAVATLVDMAAVPALSLARTDGGIGGPTVDLHVQYLGSTQDEDLIATGWIVHMTRSMAFAKAEVVTPTGRLLAVGQHTFRMLTPRPESS